MRLVLTIAADPISSQHNKTSDALAAQRVVVVIVVIIIVFNTNVDRVQLTSARRPRAIPELDMMINNNSGGGELRMRSIDE